ncbi:MAG: ROK family protein [Candidatus Latescibacterota bacterium]|nr:MAG: ROK family protein [Candidatus Latescibacterota bacterium]
MVGFNYFIRLRSINGRGKMEKLFIGVDIGGTNVASGLVDEEGNLLQRDKRPILADVSQKTSLRQIVDGIRAVAEKEGISLKEIDGIGIGSPGPLDPFQGVAFSPVNLPTWGTVPLKRIMEEELSVPVTVDNDANVVAVGERWKGAGREVDDFLCVTLGTGIGGGAICGGRLLHGFNGNAVEIGHITVDFNGPRCGCGNYGCLELYASANAMARRTRQRIEREKPESLLTEVEQITSRTVFEAAQRGDKFALEMFQETGFFLGVGLVTAINLLNVEMVALTGGLANAGDLIFEPVRRTILERGFPGVKEKVRVIPTELGEDAALLGSAKIAIDGGVFI